MILIYSQHISSRLRYIAEFMLGDIAGYSEISFSSNLQEALQWPHGLINYSPQTIGKGLWMSPVALLFETGINNPEIKTDLSEKLPRPFFNNRSADIPFDMFAACFFLVSRYEEYLPSIRDKHDRFDAASSFASKYNFLHKPVVDIWALELRNRIQQMYPQLKFMQRQFNVLSTIDIDNAYAYKHKGLMRTMGALGKALISGDAEAFTHRLQTILGFRDDPYDTYWLLDQVHKNNNLDSVYFILFSDYGHYDKNLSTDNHSFLRLIKSIADKSLLGIHPSYASNRSLIRLEREIKGLSSLIHREISISRQHFLKLNFPDTYNNLIQLDIAADYTMGYAHAIGFRAGTCTPYKFYNLDLETETALRVVPFQVMDASLLYYMKLTPEQALSESMRIADETKEVEGLFVTLWHNETIGEHRQWKGWQPVFTGLLEYAASLRTGSG
ncbi:MAG: polysaccharide deacetylase family protein [Bacteroidota bacterium]